MIYTERTKRAMQIAYEAHHGQFDKSGVPYIFHPICVAAQMKTEEECIVALLHDVLEDTDIMYEELEREFSGNVMKALNLLTHDDSVEYMEYIRNLKHNPIAKAVKLADLAHNSDLTRLPKVTERDLKRQEKYKKAIQFLNS